MNRLTIPTNGMTITEDTTFAPGAYVLPAGVTIAADGVTLDGGGAHLIGGDHQHAAVRADGVDGVTVRNLTASRYYHGLRFDHCRDLTIEGVTVRDTHEIAGIDTFLHLWQPVAEAYGGAILLNEVHGGTVRQCDIQHQLNGIQLYRCTGLNIQQNNASFNSGWGIYLAYADENTIQDNQLDFCNRVYRRQDGSIRVEADAAGIVMVHGSSRNKLLRNSCLCGGDGIFIAGYEHPGNHLSCSDNLIEDNDCRLSPNNAIESTFSQGNIFRRNDCSRSNYGLWLGYSWDNLVEDNTVEFNRWAGIAAEHTHGMVFRDNRVRLNGDGIRLWTRGGPVVQHFPGFELSYDCTVEHNLIESNLIGFNGYTGDDAGDRLGHGYTIKGNVVRDNRVGVRLARVERCAVTDNQFVANVQQAALLLGGPDVEFDANRFEANAADIVTQA